MNWQNQSIILTSGKFSKTIKVIMSNHKVKFFKNQFAGLLSIFLPWLIIMGCNIMSPTITNPITPSTPLPNAQIHIQDAASWQWNEIPAPVIEPFSQHPQVLIDTMGRIHLLWDTLGGSGNAFIYHSYFDSGQWTSPIPIAQTLGSSSLISSPIATLDGSIHVLWKNQLELGGPYRLMYAKFDGVSWRAEAELIRSEKDPNIGGSLFFDSQAVVHAVVWAPSGLDRDYYYLTNTPNGWTTSQSILPKNAGLLLTWKYVPSNEGGVRLYGRGTNGNLVYAYWQNDNVTSVKTNINLKSYEHYFGDSLGNYYIYRTDQAPIPGGITTGIYYQCIATNLTLWPDLLVSGNIKVTTAPQVATSQTRAVLSWITSDNQIHFLFPQDCGNADLYTLSLPAPEHQRASYSVAISDSPNRVCALNRILSGSELYCADIP